MQGPGTAMLAALVDALEAESRGLPAAMGELMLGSGVLVTRLGATYAGVSGMLAMNAGLGKPDVPPLPEDSDTPDRVAVAGGSCLCICCWIATWMRPSTASLKLWSALDMADWTEADTSACRACTPAVDTVAYLQCGRWIRHCR